MHTRIQLVRIDDLYQQVVQFCNAQQINNDNWDEFME